MLGGGGGVEVDGSVRIPIILFILFYPFSVSYHKHYQTGYPKHPSRNKNRNLLYDIEWIN